jgi:hypothetical protein
MNNWLEAFTFVLQIAILITVGANLVNTFRATRISRQTSVMIEGYRRELGWLMARLDALEAERGARVAR